MWSRILAAVVAVLFSVATAHAQLDLTGFAVDVDPYFEVASLVIAAIGTIWAVKKVIKLGNRS